MHVEVTEAFGRTRSANSGLFGVTTAKCRRCTLQDQLNLWTVLARARTGCDRLWAVSGTLKGCSDEASSGGVLVRARVEELWERERDHRRFLNGLWTKSPKKYADPNWSGRLSPTVTYYTEAPSTDTDDDKITDSDADTDQDVDSYNISPLTIAGTEDTSLSLKTDT
ncbi:hypothetical protein FSHL1_011479 [Fusarium sambucinum]